MNNFEKHIRDNYKEECHDITQHGCSGGVSGLIYYTETTALYDQHVEEIWDWLCESGDEQGMTALELLATFGGQKDVGGPHQFKNLLVWAYVESVCCQMVAELETA